MKGKIVKGIAGFYYVHAENKIYECKAKGVFRKDNRKPLVGDDVEMDVLDEENALGNIRELLPRRSVLIRPAVANVDQALVIFSIVKPKPNFNLLDRFLVMMEQQDIETIICFNKVDIDEVEDGCKYQEIYEKCGYRTLTVSAKQGVGIEALKELLAGRTTTVAGPSGVGKSSLINRLQSGICMETGEISRKIERGKHTTRHAEVFVVSGDTFVMDTPGFSSLYVNEIQARDLWNYFPEMKDAEQECRFTGCCHMEEPDCGVKNRVRLGEIAKQRYESYRQLYTELSQIKRY